jgi:hypothetical protein
VDDTGFLDLIARIEEYMDAGQTDGLPVSPPARPAVDAGVAAAGRKADEALGLMAPAYREVTVLDVAVNATMAGCRPEALPVLLATVEVMLEPSFNLTHLATSTKGCAPLVIVNGPVRHALGMNGAGNVFGPGNRANATIGRALRLLLINIGGAVPGVVDRATIGHPGKYTYTIAEDEEHSPWEPLHVEAGFAPDDSVVTVVSCEAPRYVNNAFADTPETVLTTVADTMRTLGSYGFSGPTECVVALVPEHRAHIAAAGWTKADVRRYLFEQCQRPAGELQAVKIGFPGVREAPPEAMIRLFREPEDIKVIAVGGPGVVSGVCYGFTGVDEERSGQRLVQVSRTSDEEAVRT